MEQVTQEEIASIEATGTKTTSNEAAPVRENSVHILLVEDIVANSMLATIMLQKMGLEVTCTENGKQAVEFCSKEKYDLLLMDCQMPEWKVTKLPKS